MQYKAQPLCGRCFPAIRPFEPICNCPEQRPLAFSERVLRIERAALRTFALHTRKRIRQHIALLDQPAIERARTISEYATERGARLPVNRRHCDEVRARVGPTQRSRGVGRRKNAR